MHGERLDGIASYVVEIVLIVVLVENQVLEHLSGHGVAANGKSNDVLLDIPETRIMQVSVQNLLAPSILALTLRLQAMI
jgi:hypothetical protein